MNNAKIISIMAVWDEQNMIGLSIASTKDIVYQYIVLIQKGIDKTREVLEYCKKLWNLNSWIFIWLILLFCVVDLDRVYGPNHERNYRNNYCLSQMNLPCFKIPFHDFFY